MGYQPVSNADRVGEAFALQVLSEHFGAEIFIGSSIETKIEELASVVYKVIGRSRILWGYHYYR